MKIATMFTAAAVAVAGLSPIALATPAAAQRTVVQERTVVTHDRGPGYGYGFRGRHHSRQVCRTVYRHHHREQICRTVRR